MTERSEDVVQVWMTSGRQDGQSKREDESKISRLASVLAEAGQCRIGPLRCKEKEGGRVEGGLTIGWKTRVQDILDSKRESLTDVYEADQHCSRRRTECTL